MASSSDLIVSVSGIRGIVNVGLTPATALAFASAFASYTNGGRIVLSRDGRPSGAMLRYAILSGLTAAGCEVLDLGIAPTPTVGFAVQTLRAAGAIQITASHNPAPWNGLKLFGPDGRILDAAKGKRVKHLFESQASQNAPYSQIGTLQDYPRAADEHRDRVIEQIDVAGIRNSGLRAFLDANGGSGGPMGRNLLRSLQVQTTYFGCEAEGIFLHEPEPTADNLKNVCSLVRQSDVDIGFALDPDADRLALIDENGRYLGEEFTLALAARFRLLRERGPIVLNMSTSRVTEDVAAQAGCSCTRSAVGEANVADEMLRVGALFGGEGNGGVIDPRVGLVRDPFIGIGLILNLMAETGKKISVLADELPQYRIVKEKFSASLDGLPKLYDVLTKRWPEATVNRIDGLRLDWQDRWVHVRPSNTEPIVRVIAEAPTEKSAAELCREVAASLVQ